MKSTLICVVLFFATFFLLEIKNGLLRYLIGLAAVLIILLLFEYDIANPSMTDWRAFISPLITYHTAFAAQEQRMKRKKMRLQENRHTA